MPGTTKSWCPKAVLCIVCIRQPEAAVPTQENALQFMGGPKAHEELPCKNVQNFTSLKEDWQLLPGLC